MSRTWIFQSNPKLYDIDAAVHARPVIYWRTPQFFEQLKQGDRVLVWRAGKEAGIIGWGVLLTDPRPYDLSKDDDPFEAKGLHRAPGDPFVPLRVWAAGHIPKAEVASVLDSHRIVTNPMGTVFRLDAEERAALDPLLAAHGYDLGREAVEPFAPLPVLSEGEAEPREKPVRAAQPRAKITPALFLLASAPEQPTEITVEGDALSMLLVEREAVRSLDESWDAVGIYLLIGGALSDDSALSVYVGKAQGLRSRVRSPGHATKDWTRCLLVRREGRQPFNASDISWLERRLIDVLLEAPAIDLVNRTPPPAEYVPDYKAEILERTVLAALGVLGVLGGYVT